MCLDVGTHISEGTEVPVVAATWLVLLLALPPSKRVARRREMRRGGECGFLLHLHSLDVCVISRRGHDAAADHLFPVPAVKHEGEMKKRLDANIGTRSRAVPWVGSPGSHGSHGAPQRSRML